MADIHTPLLIVGSGPAALVAAKVASGWGLPCFLVGQQPHEDLKPTELDGRSQSILERHGVLAVLRPYATRHDPFTITPVSFERALKHHCVADTLITVYDGMSVQDLRPEGRGVAAVLTDGHRTWGIRADAYLDVGTLPTALNEAIQQAARFSDDLVGAGGRQAEP